MPDRERNRSEEKSGLSQNIILFDINRSGLLFWRFSESKKPNNKNRLDRWLFEENNGIFYPNPTFTQLITSFSVRH